MTAPTPAISRRILAALAERPGTDGERTGAGHAVGRLVIAHSDAIRALISGTDASPPSSSPHDPPWRLLCIRCLRHPHGLRRWETDFLRSLHGFPRCSPKQRAVLHAIAERIGIGPER